MHLQCTACPPSRHSPPLPRRRDLEEAGVATLGQLLECYPSRVLSGTLPGALPDEAGLDDRTLYTLAVQVTSAPVRTREAVAQTKNQDMAVRVLRVVGRTPTALGGPGLLLPSPPQPSLATRLAPSSHPLRR